MLAAVIEGDEVERGRYLMLNRMVDQQIEQMEDFLDTNG